MPTPIPALLHGISLPVLLGCDGEPAETVLLVHSLAASVHRCELLLGRAEGLACETSRDLARPRCVLAEVVLPGQSLARAFIARARGRSLRRSGAAGTLEISLTRVGNRIVLVRARPAWRPRSKSGSLRRARVRLTRPFRIRFLRMRLYIDPSPSVCGFLSMPRRYAGQEPMEIGETPTVSLPFPPRSRAVRALPARAGRASRRRARGSPRRS